MKISQQVKRDLKNHLLEQLSAENESVEVISAYKFENQDWSDFYSKFPDLKGKKTTNTVNPDIIAGFIVRIGSQMMDLSIETVLSNLKNKSYEAA